MMNSFENEINCLNIPSRLDIINNKIKLFSCERISVSEACENQSIKSEKKDIKTEKKQELNLKK